jgi:uncharacterized protein (DUF488 family)
VADVRTVPRSRRYPQFDRHALPGPLHAAGIAYDHLPGLGGLRQPRPDSINTAWREPGLRGYADHMQTLAFERELGGLIAGAAQRRTAVMCAEASPWQCHRALLSDALVAHGVAVLHILGAESLCSHEPTPFGRTVGGRVTYPGLAGLTAPSGGDPSD